MAIFIKIMKCFLKHASFVLFVPRGVLVGKCQIAEGDLFIQCREIFPHLQYYKNDSVMQV